MLNSAPLETLEAPKTWDKDPRVTLFKTYISYNVTRELLPFVFKKRLFFRNAEDKKRRPLESGNFSILGGAPLAERIISVVSLRDRRTTKIRGRNH